MNKYIVLALLPVLFQSTIECSNANADINHAIQQQLISARKSIGNIKLTLDLDVILQALVSFAKRSDDQAVEAVHRMDDIRMALQQYRSDQYTAWATIQSWFNYHPEIVTQHIDPAIARVDAALSTLKTNSNSLGYKVAAGLAVTAVAAATAWWLKNYSTYNPDANIGDVYLDVRTVEIVNDVMNQVGFKDDSKGTYYGYAYDYIYEVLAGEKNSEEYSVGSTEYKILVKETVGFIKDAYRKDNSMNQVVPIEIPDDQPFQSSDNPLWAHGKK